MFIRTLRRNGVVSLAAMLLLTLTTASAAAPASKESADVLGQGMGGPVVSPDGATLIRSDTGLNVSLRMATPEPDSYNYPPGNAFNPDAIPGRPEVFTLWVFVFNFPDDCSADPCDLADFAAGRGAGGAFLGAGHVVGGPELRLSGRVSLTSDSFAGSPLLAPRTAEVHLAVAPHGAVQPEFLPAQIQTPIGDPSFWWLAFFLID